MLPTLSNEKFSCTVRLSITGISHVCDVFTDDSTSGINSNPTPSNIISINAIPSIPNYCTWNINLGVEFIIEYIDGLMQKKRNSIARALGLRRFCIKPFIWHCRYIAIVSQYWDVTGGWNPALQKTRIPSSFLSCSCDELARHGAGASGQW